MSTAAQGHAHARLWPHLGAWSGLTGRNSQKAAELWAEEACKGAQHPGESTGHSERISTSGQPFRGALVTHWPAGETEAGDSGKGRAARVVLSLSVKHREDTHTPSRA